MTFEDKARQAMLSMSIPAEVIAQADEAAALMRTVNKFYNAQSLDFVTAAVLLAFTDEAIWSSILAQHDFGASMEPILKSLVREEGEPVIVYLRRVRHSRDRKSDLPQVPTVLLSAVLYVRSQHAEGRDKDRLELMYELLTHSCSI